MTFEVLQGTRPGSYEGASFLVEEHKATEGRNNATFLYINGTRRAYKDLGAYPADGSLTVITHGKGNDYYTRRDALRRALNSPVAGKLVHPFLGNLTIKPGKFSYSESFTEIGVCRFTIPYEVVDENAGNPLVARFSVSNSASIKSLALAANRALQRSASNSFVATTNLNRDCAKSLFRTALDAMRNKLAKVGDALSKVDAFAGKALAVSEQAAFYADNPMIGFATLADGLLGVDGLTTGMFAKFKAFETLFTFGNDGTRLSVANTSPVRVADDPMTTEDAERKNNAQIMVTFMQAGCTIEAIQNLGKARFGSVEEINLYQKKIERQIEVIQQQMTGNDEQQLFRFPIRRPDYLETNSAINDLAQALNQYLEAQRLTTPRVDIIDVAPQPASVLAYTLYGDSTRGDEIMKLNGFTDNMRVSGRVLVLSA